MEVRVNLIPENKKQELVHLKKVKISLFLETVILIIILIFSGLLFSYNYILNVNISSMHRTKEGVNRAEEYKKMNDLDDEFKIANEKMAEMSTVDKEQLYWSDLLIRLSRLVDEGVIISDISTRNFNLFIAGIADNRDKLISFKEQLEKEGCFEEINLPLSNLVAKDNVSFQIDLRAKEECLKKK